MSSMLIIKLFSLSLKSLLDLNLIKIFADLTNIKLTDDEIQRMHILSGGLTRIIKFFLNHKEMVGLSASKILENSDFKRVFLPTAEVIEKCEDEILEKLGIKVDLLTYGSVHPMLRNTILNDQKIFYEKKS